MTRDRPGDVVERGIPCRRCGAEVTAGMMVVVDVRRGRTWEVYSYYCAGCGRRHAEPSETPEESAVAIGYVGDARHASTGGRYLVLQDPDVLSYSPAPGTP